MTVRRGDVLLICSDGLSGPVDDEVIRRTLEEAGSPVEAAEALIALANAAGGPDNVTAIVARIEGDGLEPRAIAPDPSVTVAPVDPSMPDDDAGDPGEPRRGALRPGG